MENKKVLIIEDDPDILDLYVEVLTDAGYAVDKAADGLTGKAKAITGEYAVVLLDIMLPKMDGLEILKALKTNPDTKSVPVILLTNLGRETVIKEGFELGAEGYLIKSEHTPDQIVSEVKKFLEIRSQ